MLGVRVLIPGSWMVGVLYTSEVALPSGRQAGSFRDITYAFDEDAQPPTITCRNQVSGVPII